MNQRCYLSLIRGKSVLLDLSQPVLIYVHGRSVFEGRAQARKIKRRERKTVTTVWSVRSSKQGAEPYDDSL